MIAELDTSTAPATAAQIQYINLGDLHPSPTNPRKHFDEAGIDEMASSIEEHGVKMPLLCRPSKTEPGKKEIVAGERRYRGSVRLVERLAKLIEKGDSVVVGEEFTPPEEVARLTALYSARIEVRCIVEDLDDTTVLELQLVENLQRKDLTALEEAEGYQRLLDLKDKEYTPAKIAQKIGKHVQTVLFKLRMLQAPKSMREALEAGKVGERHLVLVATVLGAKAREECAKAILKGEWDWRTQSDQPKSVKQTIEYIGQHHRQSLKKAAWSLDDAELVKSAGPCSMCPHFAKKAAEQDPELAKELGNERGQTDPLTCMNPACFKSKQDAAWKQREALAKDEQVKVLKPKEAEKIISNEGSLRGPSKFVKLDEKPDYDITGHWDDEKTPTWRELTKDRLPAGAVTVVNTTQAGIVELLDKKQAVELAKAHPKYGKIFAKVKASGKPELTTAQKNAKAKEAFKNKVNARVRTVLLQYLYDSALTRGTDAEFSMTVLNTALHESGMDGNRLICEWLKLEPTEPKKGNSKNQSNYREAIINSLTARDAGKPEIDAMIMIAIVASWVKIYGVDTSLMEYLQKLFGYDKKHIIALAEADVQKEIDAKEAKKKPAKPEKVVKASKNSSDPNNVSVAHEASKTKAADKRAKKGLAPEQREKILEAQKKRWAKTAAKSSVKGSSDNTEDYSKAAGKRSLPLGVGKLAPGIFGKGPAKVAAEPDPRHETGYYHCDTCGGVCAVGPDLVPDIKALKVGEFQCSECAEHRIFGTEFPLVGNQEDYETWVPSAGADAADDADFNDAE